MLGRMELLADYTNPIPNHNYTDKIQVYNAYSGNLTRIYTIRYNTHTDIELLMGNNDTDSETEEFDDECDIWDRRIKGYYVRRIFLSRIKRLLEEGMFELTWLLLG